jgi:intracellular septation protein A
MSDSATITAERSVHPLVHAGKWLLSDLLSTLTFVVLYAATHSVVLSVSLGIALGIAQIIYLKWRRAQIDAMQWLSLGLVVVFGGASLLTHNPIFFKLKITIIYTAVGCVMLRRGWQTRYLPPIAQALAGDLCTAFGYIWCATMFATAAANLLLALFASTAAWSLFIAIFPLASKLALTAIQYSVTRTIVRRRLRLAPFPA